MNKILTVLAIFLGLILIIAGIVYFLEPARYLPSFFPGHDRALMKHHYTHGIASIILGIACFIFAWFQSGKKKQTAEKESVKEEQNS